MAKFNKKDQGETAPNHKGLQKALGHHIESGKLRITIDSVGNDMFDDFDQESRSTGRGKVGIAHGKAGAGDRPGTEKGKRTFPKKKLALD